MLLSTHEGNTTPSGLARCSLGQSLVVEVLFKLKQETQQHVNNMYKLSLGFWVSVGGLLGSGFVENDSKQTHCTIRV